MPRPAGGGACALNAAESERAGTDLPVSAGPPSAARPAAVPAAPRPLKGRESSSAKSSRRGLASGMSCQACILAKVKPPPSTPCRSARS